MTTPPIRKKVSIVIPALNEEDGIGVVITQIPHDTLRERGYMAEVIVVDNGSTDRTAEIARAAGATVVYQPIRGYGNAYKVGFAAATGDIIATGDADSTYPLDTLPELLAVIEERELDFLSGNRLATLRRESMSRWHLFGNWVLSTLTNILFRTPFKDSQSGMWVFKREVWDILDVEHGGMPFSQELKIEAHYKGFACGEESIDYRPRVGEVKLRGMHDALINLSQLFTKRLSIRRAPVAHVQRIAFVLDAVWPYQKGGRERRLSEISKRLVREGREIHVYTMQWWDGARDMERGGVHYHAICKHYPLYTAQGRRSIYQALMFSLAVFKLLFKKFDVLDVDHMPQFALFSARIVTWLKGKKLYATWHEVWGRKYWTQYLGGVGGIFGFVVEWLSFKMPDVIISNSANTTERIFAAGFKREVKTVSLGVDIQGIYDAEVSADKSDVIFVGRLLSHKNADVLVRAIALVALLHPAIKVLIVGDGPERASVQTLINDLGLHDNVRMYAKFEDDADVYSLMKASKMLVLPSVREGFGLVAVEAHAAGIPVITTTHADNAAKDLIQEGINGFLSETTPESIAEKILAVLDNRDSMEPRRGVEEYDWNHVTQTLEKVFA